MPAASAVASPAWWSPAVLGARHEQHDAAEPAVRQRVAQKVSRPCTTAADVHNLALGPAMDIVALLHWAGEPLARLLALAGDDEQAVAAAHSLADIGHAIGHCARTMIPLLETAYDRLVVAEQQGGYGSMPPEVDSEGESGRALARGVSRGVDTLARSSSPSERKAARIALGHLFAEHGEALFERRVTSRMAPDVLPDARKAYALWKMQQAYAAAGAGR